MLTLNQEKDLGKLAEKWQKECRNIDIEMSKTDSIQRKKLGKLMKNLLGRCAGELEQILYRHDRQDAS